MIDGQRILLKISGESLMDKNKSIHDNKMINQICDDILEVYKRKYKICLTVGGGNICRGLNLIKIGIERVSADYMGMLSTVINAIALQSKLEKKNLNTRILSAIPILSIAEQHIRRKAIRHLEKDRIVIFASGTGTPFFTTDTSAALRAIEMNCTIFLKGTKVDGVYNEDPHKNSRAKHFKNLSYKEVIDKNLSVMDPTSVTLAKDNKLPIKVFDINKKGNLGKILNNKGNFTLIN